MPKFYVERMERYSQTMIVEAESWEEAVAIVVNDGGEEGDFVFVETMDPANWIVSDDEGHYYDGG